MSAVVAAVSCSATHDCSELNQESIQLLTGLGVKVDSHSDETVKQRARVSLDPNKPNLRQVHLIHMEFYEAFERCQVRSEEYPEGDHGWMVRGERFVDCYTLKYLLGGDYPTGELIEEAYGKRTTTRTCWLCGFTTEPRDEWGKVWVVAA